MKENSDNWWAFIISVFLLIAIAVLTLGCSPKSTEITEGVDVRYVLESNDFLVMKLTKLEDELFVLKLAEHIQVWYAKQGVNKSFRLVKDTVRQAFTIAPTYDLDLPEGMTSDTFAYYLLTFSCKESDFNPMLVGKAGDSGIAQTLKRDYPRLIKKARKRGLDFKDDIQSIRTGLICCAEEYLEKVDLSKGDPKEAIWKYNGSKTYLKDWLKRYRFIRYGE